tara:strand:- start:464 stop:1069 length:606 start_codon:yes stop_codon:yes gene_type:complete
VAKSLNKSRMRNSKIIVILAFILVFFTKALIPYETPIHELTDFLGYVLIALCALGRLYTTAFLGGHKNESLITYGAFSVVRNPLYFFSLLGMTGVALISGHVLIMILVPIIFIVMYHFLIKREEEFLLETFGGDYQNYMNVTPRLFPNIKLYNAPDNITVVPKYLNKAFKDAIWWFAAYPIFEMAEYLQESGLLPTLFTMP